MFPLSCIWEINNLKTTKKNTQCSLCPVSGKYTISKLQKRNTRCPGCPVSRKFTILEMQKKKYTMSWVSCIKEIHNLKNTKKEIHDVLGVLYLGKTQSQKCKKRNTQCLLSCSWEMQNIKNTKKEIHDVLGVLQLGNTQYQKKI